MKKILFVNSTLTSGGSEKVMVMLANELSKTNEVYMILVKESKNETYKLNDSIKCNKFTYKHKNKILKLLERIKKIRQNIKKNNYDCIISFMYDINRSVLLSTLGLKVPVIISERNNPAARKNNFILKIIDNILYKKSKKIVLQTNQVKKFFSTKLQSKIVVIPNPISNQIENAYKGKRKNKIVAVGRLVEQKNFEMLIEAFSEISKQYNKYNLIIYGEGYLRKKLENLIEQLNIADKVMLPGYVENVNSLMNDAKMYISSSNYEGISNSMLEALSMGIPTICTDCPVGGAAMVIKDHENGILIPVGDLNGLILAMKELIADKELAEKLSANSVLIKKQLNISNIAKKWEKIINNI